MKLQPRVFSLVIGVLVISSLALAMPLYWYNRIALEEEFDRHLMQFAELVSRGLNLDLLQTLAQEPGLPSIRLAVNEQLHSAITGGVLAIAIYSGTGQRLIEWPQEDHQQLPRSILPLVITDSGVDKLDMVTDVFRLANGDYVKAGIRTMAHSGYPPLCLVIWSRADFITSSGRLAGSLFWIIIASALVAISFAVFFSRSLIKPVKQLSIYTHSIRDNIYAVEVDLGRTDEFGDLNRALLEMHQEIQHNEQSMKNLLSGIAHEIKNPLGGMEIYTGLLKESFASDSTDQELADSQSYLEKVVTELGHLKRIVLEYLDYAKPVRDRLKTLSVVVVMEDIRRLLQPVMRRKNIVFSCLGNGIVIGDESKIRRVFLNLLENSIEAVAEGGQISVEITGHNDRVSIAVSDNGKGIPPADIQSVFDPYFTSKAKGHGLGLAIVKNIVAEMNGTVIVSSEWGRGTKFILSFPGALHG